MEWFFLVVYLLTLAALTVFGSLIAAPIFQALPQKGAAFALPMALTLFTIAVFWLGQLTFGLHTLVFGVVVVIATGVAASRSGVTPAWRDVAATYGVFAVGFLIMLAFRTAEPGVTPNGGEQFLHFALVNAIERANSLPPEDMWFAGRPLRYYYGTQLQVASLSMITGTPVRYGYNLGIAIFYGLLFVVAYGISGAIVYRWGHSHQLGGMLGAFFVAVAGPTTPAVRFATPYLPKPVAEAVKPAAFGFVADRFEGGDLSQAVAELSTPFDWGWWYTRYVVHGTLQEVPLYSFVKADLHGHTFANGYVLFAAALALAYYATPSEKRLRRNVIIFGGLGAVAGLFGFMNTWSLPTATGLTVLAVAAADPHPATLLPTPWAKYLQSSTISNSENSIAQFVQEIWRLILATVVGIVVLAIGLTVASPFLVFGHVPSNNGIGLFPPRSPLGPFLIIYGGLLAIFTVYVLAQGWPVIMDIRNRWLLACGFFLGTAMAATTLLLDFGVIAVLGPLIVAGWVLVRFDRGNFGLVLLIAGAGLLLSLELVHARLPLIDHPRWNTSLKVAVQAWTLGAAGSGVATAVLLARSTAGLVPTSDSQRIPTDDWNVDIAMMSHFLLVAMLIIVMLASAVFPVMTGAIEVGDPLVEGTYDPSTDAFNAVERNYSDEYEALLWLDNRDGHPTIVEAPGNSYDWTSQAATFSGLPGVVGWDHEAEYRSPQAYERRVTHVDAIYTGEWAKAARYLKRYDVTYVYVGPNERDRYGSTLRLFDRNAFSVAFEDDAVTIYRVNQSSVSYP